MNVKACGNQEQRFHDDATQFGSGVGSGVAGAAGGAWGWDVGGHDVEDDDGRGEERAGIGSCDVIDGGCD